MPPAIRAIGRSRVAPIAGSVIVLAALVWWASRQDSPELPSRGAEVMYLLLAVLIYAGATLARAERWRQLLRASDVRASTRDVYLLTPVGYMGNNVLPARAGELLRVLLLAPRAGASRTNVLGTIVAERLLDAVVLCLLFFVAAAGTVAVSRWVDGVVLLITAVAVAFVAISVHLGGRRFAARRPWVARALARLRELTHATSRIRGRNAYRLGALSLFVWAAEAAVYLLVADSLGIEMSAAEAVSVMVVANVAALIPAAPGYLGTFDAAVVVSMEALGMLHSASVGYLLVLRFVLFVPITLVGLVIYVGGYAGFGRLRETRLRAEEA